MLDLNTLPDIDRKLILESYINDACACLTASQRACREDYERYAEEDMWPFVSAGKVLAHDVCGNTYVYRKESGEPYRTDIGWGAVGLDTMQTYSNPPSAPTASAHVGKKG